MRWLWIDRFTAFEPGRSARAVKNVTMAEEHLHDHFPGAPMMPASLVIEGFAQTGGILVGHARDFREKVILAKVVKAIFTREAVPGDQLTYEAAVVGEVRDEGASTAGRVLCNGEPMAEIEMLFTHLDNSGNRVGPAEGNFVFDEQFRQLVASYLAFSR
jgi:3-hydroxyacyl-[acyl-carrier-protein] dehydratase